MYVYDALPTAGSIRLFVLEPGTGEQPLRGSLSTCNLDDAPYFEAISYVWGSPDRCIELICDGQQIFITLSLSDVLHRVRLPDRARTLWTDLICINQGDLGEKGPQVCLMGSLYRRSHRTLIHVGSDDEGYGEPLVGLLNDIDRTVLANLSVEWDSAPFIDEDHPLAHDSRWESLRLLLSKPWFWRGWVVQEAAYARDGVVLWGGLEFSWTAITRTTIWAINRASSAIFQKFNLQISELHVSCFSLLSKDKVQPFMSESSWRSFGRVLDTFHNGRSHHLADPRDRIYALYDLPASNRSEELQIIPDYHQSFLEVCKGLALNYLDAYDDLDLLLYVVHDEESLEREFPSWIPLWGASNRQDEEFQAHYADQAPLIEKQETFSITGGGNRMLVSGLRFAKVQMVSSVLSKQHLTFEGIARLWSEVCAVHNPKFSTDSHCFSMFIAALCLGLKDSDVKSKRDVQGKAAFTLVISNIATGQAKHSINPTPSEQQARGGDAQKVLHHIQYMAQNKRIIVTDRGYGMAPAQAREGDECVVLHGGKMPFVLRKAHGAGNYKLIGPMFHSSEHLWEDRDTGWQMALGLDEVRDWEDWDIEEEAFCVV